MKTRIQRYPRHASIWLGVAGVMTSIAPLCAQSTAPAASAPTDPQVIARYDTNGNGQLEWRRGRTACRTRAQARFDGAILRLRDSDTTCNDGSHWYADQLVCRRGADNVAQCSGSSRGAYGPVSWTVNLHKLD